MSKPQKILEIKGQNWMGGISIQDSFSLGGIFQSSNNNFDPFDLMGFFRATLSPVQIDATKVLQIMNSCVYGNDGTAYVVFLGNRTGAGTKNIYRIKASDLTVTDASLTGSSGAGAINFGGLGFSNGLAGTSGRLIFADTSAGNIYSLILSTLATEVLLISPVGFNAANQPPVFHNAPDGNTYFTRGVDNGQVGRIDTVTGAGTNIGNAFTGNPMYTPKDLTTDGRYEIILMDDNPTRVQGVTSNCKVYYWDMDNANPQLVLTIPDDYVISARWVDGRLLVIGKSGIWQCGIASAPKLVFPLSVSQLPSNPYMVSVQGNIMYWASASFGNGGANVYAYGSKIGNPKFFCPYNTASVGNLHTALISSGTSIFAALDATVASTKIYVHNTGATRSNAILSTTPTVLDQPYKFSYLKLTLKQKLTSGQSVAIGVFNSAGETIMDTQTVSYSAANPKRTFVFEKGATAAGGISEFEDVYITVNPQGGAIVQRVALYGDGGSAESSDKSQNI